MANVKIEGRMGVVLDSIQNKENLKATTFTVQSTACTQTLTL